jgi:hypothetical protein
VGWLLLVVIALPSAASAMELVTNGDFEEDLAPAWDVEAVGSAAAVTRGTGYDGDPDFEVLAEKGTGNGHGKLSQVIVIPSTDLEVSVNLRMEVSATAGGPWAAAGLALYYEDAFGNLLGTTAIVRTTPDCPWVDGDTFHVIPAPDEAWHGYVVGVDDELLNLPGVDPVTIHQLRISLLAQVGGDC